METKLTNKYSLYIMNFDIPIRCYTCNLPIAGKWNEYQKLCKEYRKDDGRDANDNLTYITSTLKKTAEGRAMDTLGLTRECCRRHMLTHPT
jgi:DNA-directed RNA polymerase subunit N (RpoN/RPB10)